MQDRNEAAQTLFQAADTDSSGTIEFAEFVAMPVNQGKTKEELRAAKKLEHVSSTVLGKGGK